MSILRPLASRYATWLGLPAEATADTSDEQPDQVWAMPLILRMERDSPATRTDLLEAAASAALAVCMDSRAEASGPWHEAMSSWIAGRIRKVSRRARGAQWQAVQELPGTTIRVREAEARALVPFLVSDTPKIVSRLQISGSDLPPDNPGPTSVGLPLLLLNPRVSMTVGKAAAQVGHATMLLASVLDPEELATWANAEYRCAVRTPEPHVWDESAAAASAARGDVSSENKAVFVRDAGFTEIAPGTVTVMAQWRG